MDSAGKLRRENPHGRSRARSARLCRSSVNTFCTCVPLIRYRRLRVSRDQKAYIRGGIDTRSVEAEDRRSVYPVRCLELVRLFRTTDRNRLVHSERACASFLVWITRKSQRLNGASLPPTSGLSFSSHCSRACEPGYLAPKNPASGQLPLCSAAVCTWQECGPDRPRRDGSTFRSAIVKIGHEFFLLTESVAPIDATRFMEKVSTIDPGQTGQTDTPLA